ncbi:hypothetical protein J132_10849 [Termitomyces sp. J132]|nr:hypothetical protein H2248_010127 [Termitomyces sp. 'cryptogamus']KNZ79300.1 hypothetical protein J132_10849 [Termitomyces sp. J132]
MLVNVVPLTTNVQLAAVVFSIVFEDLDPVVTPSTWTTHLHNLRLDELEVPALLHALDKSIGIICLLEEVTFDLSARTISCHFVDGSMEQWPLVGQQCINTLNRVVQDVNESSFVLEQQMGDKQRERKRFEAPLPPPPAKASRHKKQRSLLRTLVASIIPLYSPSNSRLPSPPPTPISEKKPSPTISPRVRRRRARSALVDAFRLYIFSELSKRFPRGGYTTWIIQSMLRRATEAMERVINEVGGPNDSESGFLHRDGTEFSPATPDSLPPTPSVCDDDGETILTDTDGSSVHTPTSLHAQFSPVPARRHSYVSRSPRRLLSGSNYALYAQHAALVGRLRRLVMIDQDRQEQEAEELKHHHCLLEIQSRRRAWLNKTLIGGVRSQHVDLGMSTVFDSSPLAQHSWSSEEYEYVPEELVHSLQRRQPYDEYDKVRLRMKRSQRCMITPKLFPVSEEDGEDVDTVRDARELELDFEDFEVDLETGIRWTDSDESSHNEPVMALPLSFEIERPQLRPRVRTSSIHKNRLHVSPSAGLEPEQPLSQLAASSILCQPLLSIGHAPNQDDLSPSVYTEADVNLNLSQVDVSGYGGFGKCAEDEFTLAMDLPVNVRCEDRGVLTNKRRLSFGSDRSWFFSRSSRLAGIGDLPCR